MCAVIATLSNLVKLHVHVALDAHDEPDPALSAAIVDAIIAGGAALTHLFADALLPADAVRAYEALDATVFQGRILHVLPARNRAEWEEAVEATKTVGAEHNYLVHLTHRVGHQELLDRLPENVTPAYDGLSIEI